MYQLDNVDDHNEDSRKLGALLRQSREDAGLTKEEMAASLQTTKSVVSRMENNAGSMRISTLRKYAKSLDCSSSDDLKIELFTNARNTRIRRIAL